MNGFIVLIHVIESLGLVLQIVFTVGLLLALVAMFLLVNDVFDQKDGK
jgi:hypothetical protein